MYERLLNKNQKPTYEEMVTYCGNTAEMFNTLNKWLTTEYKTTPTIVFPYGNNYGWGINQKIKNKLICNVFCENNAFTVMIRLTNIEWNELYNKVSDYTREYIDHKYPCNDGGWIHYRIKNIEDLDDIKTIIKTKFNK